MKTIFKFFAISLASLMILGFLGTSTSYATSVCSGSMTVYFIDSNGNPLEGGQLSFQDNGWQTATDMGGGVFCVSTTKTNINLRMTYLGAELFVTAPTNTSYTFQTVLVIFELRKRTGALGYNKGQISFVGFGPTPLAITGSDGLGLAKIELLPREYTFKMKFRGGRGDITQDISVNPVVTWQMARMLIQINKSNGERGINGAVIKYKGYNLEKFGTTGTSENGRARRDLLPGTYKFTIKYMGGSMVVEDFVVNSGDNTLIINSKAVTVELLDGATPVDGGIVTNVGVQSSSFGTTGDSGSGIVTKDLLPLTYTFNMKYGVDSDEKVGIDCSAGAWITFYKADLKSSLVSGNTMEIATYPNPFVGNTTIAFDLETSQHVNAVVYDITGKQVAQLFEGNLSEGTHKLQWDGQGLNSGIYIVKLTTETTSSSVRIVKN